jgi:hypothetical protein
MEKAEVYWTCSCGSKVKAVLDMSKASVTVQCPTRPCKVTRTLPGNVTQLSVEKAPGVWTLMDLTGLIYPADRG